MGRFRRIYPVREREDDTYCRFFEQTSSLCAETAASKARMELARLQVTDVGSYCCTYQHVGKKVGFPVHTNNVHM